jgi:uncharacterized protein (TIGR01777 family)
MNLKVAICGATGLIGRSLGSEIRSQGGTLVPIGRKDLQLGLYHLMGCLESVDVVVNLAGTPIMGRWTPRRKQDILSSRIQTTRLLVAAINKMERAPSVFISSSAVGIYNNFDVHDEFSSQFANDFLSDVCQYWEQEAFKLDASRVRLSIFRFGVVLASGNGALKHMLLPFRFGMGGVIGSGKQMFPWIHITDVVNAIVWAIHTPEVKGIYNVVAPQIINNKEFSMTLGAVLNRPVVFSIPLWLLRLFFGEGAGILVEGQQVIPHRLLADGFKFSFPVLEQALFNILKRSG